MRINNPRSFIGGSNDNVAYNLVTNKELINEKNALSSAMEAYDLALSSKFTANDIELDRKIVTEVSGIYDYITGKKVSSRALSDYGYAWLGKDGKIPPQLIPSLAISETRVISDLELFDNDIPDAVLSGQSDAETKSKIESWLTNAANNWFDLVNNAPSELNNFPKPTTNAFLAQRGDIIIVVPSASGSKGNPNIHGSWIVTTADQDDTYPKANDDDTTTGAQVINIKDDRYQVARLSYDNGNIITINKVGLDSGVGAAPGEITLHLRQILNQSHYFTTDSNTDPSSIAGLTPDRAKELEETVYRLAMVPDTLNGGKRFAFINGYNQDEAPVSYARLDELTNVSGYFTDEVNRIDAALLTLSGENGIIDTVSSYLSGAISDEIDNRIAAVQAEEDARIAAVSDEATLRLNNDTALSGHVTTMSGWLGTKGQGDVTTYDSSWGSTSANLTQRVNQLRYELTKRTSALNEINSNIADLVRKFNIVANNSVLLRYETFQWNANTDCEVVGDIATWTYEFNTPIVSDNELEYTGSQYPFRIVAVYDENDNISYPDIIIDKSTGKTIIKVQTEIDLPGEISLENKTWTLLIAEPIKRINTNITPNLDKVSYNSNIEGNINDLINAGTVRDEGSINWIVQ